LLEETYEVLAALDANDAEAMREEFGDLLLQIVLHAQIALEYGEYSLAEVIADINAKIIRRHPHVFGDVKLGTAQEVVVNWEKLKAAERAANGKSAPKEPGALGDTPPALPALMQAETYQRRAARVGFDWPDITGVKAKVLEELDEIAVADDLEDEVGDLLFAVVNYARWLHIEPESALRRANTKFATRFAQVEAAAKAQGRTLKEMSVEELDALWEKAKENWRIRGL
jgi:tetrapyrrole methylase family protein/MazG family protein